MNILASKVRFVLPDEPFGKYIRDLDLLTNEIKLLQKKAGTSNKKFVKAFSEVYAAAKDDKKLDGLIEKPIQVRALAILLQSDIKEHVQLTEELFEKINAVRPNPSSLLIENIYQHYLYYYDHLDDSSIVAFWLKMALAKKGKLDGGVKNILSKTGPKWLAEKAINKNSDFLEQVKYLGLEQYASGRFLTLSKNIYFVKQLEKIPVNQPHDLLLEVQNKSTYESRYDEHKLLGHKILEILIERAPINDIDDSWLNVIMTIAGDPRVPYTHPKYQKWWSALPNSSNLKVKGWLSRLDLRLFLEALKNYSDNSFQSDLQRMYPARKRFLEGLLDKNLISNTRLFLTQGFISYLKRNYKPEHLPSFSRVTTGSISVIHIQFRDSEANIIEGSHSCQLWVYKSLNPSAVVFDLNKSGATYSALTSGLNSKMKDDNGVPLLIENIIHHPPLNWQNKAINALDIAGVKISARDVLTDEDYLRYKRSYGVG